MDSVTLQEKAVNSFETSDIDSPATPRISLEDQNPQPLHYGNLQTCTSL